MSNVKWRQVDEVRKMKDTCAYIYSVFTASIAYVLLLLLRSLRIQFIHVHVGYDWLFDTSVFAYKLREMSRGIFPNGLVRFDRYVLPSFADSSGQLLFNCIGRGGEGKIQLSIYIKILTATRYKLVYT